MAEIATPAPRARSIFRIVTHPRHREALWGILCVAPAIMGFVLWYLGPMIASFYMAFTDWSVAGSHSWIGTANFEEIFRSDRLFLESSKVTSIYALVSVPLRIVVAFALACLLNQPIKGLPIFRTIFYLPSTVPIIAASVIWLWLFNPDFGLLNSLLEPLGFPKIQWIYASDTALASLILMSLWDIGPMMIIFLAGLQGVPQHLYDAVAVDGGNAWHRLRSVTVPMVTPTILFNLVLSIISALQTFTQVYVMTNGGPNNATLLYGLYLYRKAFQQGDLGYAAALGVILFVVIAALSYLVFRSSSRWVYYGGGT